jgi:hypothetical protein
MMAGLELAYKGLTFETLKYLLFSLYFWKKGMSEEECAEHARYVLPMQHNIDNPIEPGSQDTWIEYWINEDDRLTQDYYAGKTDETLKVAELTIRFLGKRAEQWAKVLHHLTMRASAMTMFEEYVNGHFLEYVGPVIPMNVDYFGVGNTSIAFDVTMRVEYKEYIELDWEPLAFIEVPGGEIVEGSMSS